ncbi:MAG: M1 family metallopeptidase [Bacteroidota bacterium]
MKTFFCLFFPFLLGAQNFTRQDSLLGSNTAERSWWNVTHYAISVEPDYAAKTIRGTSTISFTVTGRQTEMQVDLDKALQIDSILMRGKKLQFKRDGGLFLLTIDQTLFREQEYSILIFYSGKPREAVKAPWDGGWVWSQDEKGRPWMSVACQGIGASIWYPCKDYQGDEPEKGSQLTMIVPRELQAVSNGNLLSESELNGKKQVTWKIVNPINNYNIIPYIGHYVNWKETFAGEKGALDCSYWVLDYELERAKAQFTQVPEMLSCFERWFGPYPFYEDGYRLIQSPYLGMEHQSGIAYGNGFQNGYYGKDLSATGWGLKWDFIIVHESGHEWFGNNITSKDIADMWIHESFTNYSETIFTECRYGKDAANAYVAGIRKNIENDIPIIGHYGVRNEGSGDMYYKGGNLVHLIRQLMSDDERFRLMLREMNRKFYHQTVSSREIEAFISEFSGLKLDKVFDQYLRSKDIPVLEFKCKKGSLSYRWSSSVPGFDMKVRLKDGSWIEPKTQWTKVTAAEKKKPEVDAGFYIKVK